VPSSADVMVVNLFGWLLCCGGMGVGGRPRSFGAARFSLTMALGVITVIWGPGVLHVGASQVGL